MTVPSSPFLSISVPAARWRRNLLAGAAMASSAPPAKVTSCTAISCFPPSKRAPGPRAVTRPPSSAPSRSRSRSIRTASARWPIHASGRRALPAEDKANIHDPREMERKAASVADQAHRRWLVSSDPEEHVEQIRPYIELGFTHLIFHAPGDDQSRFLQLYSKEILPRLRRL